MRRRWISLMATLTAWVAMPRAGVAQLPTPTYGWNLGNDLEAVPNEGAWGPVATQTLINNVAAAGFNTIRIPCAWDTHANQSTLQIDPVFMARVKQVVDWCYARNLYVIVNCHWDGGWLDKHIGDTPDATVTQKMKSYWTQIATTFQDYDDHLLFAGANEPPVDTTAQMATLMAYYQTFVDAVRAAGGHNATRWLVVQGPNTNIDKTYDMMNTLPTDSTSGRLMVEIHHYPYQWSIMTSDASWGKMFYFWGKGYHSPTMTDRNSTWGEEDYTDAQFQKMATKFVSKGVPVIIGEFGAVKRTGYADLSGTELNRHLASRTYYNKTIVDKANAYGLKPIYWDAGGTGTNTMWLFDRSQSGAPLMDPDNARALTGGAALLPPGATPPPTKPAQQVVADSDSTNRIVNLSTRGVAEAGANAMIVGFVIKGTGTKQVRIRAVAQTLLDYGLTGVLRKPLLTLYDGNQAVIKTAQTQDTYGPYDAGSHAYPVKPEVTAAFQAVGGFGLDANAAGGAPDGTNPCGDAVMIVDLPPGQYTASITPDADTAQPGVDSATTRGSSGIVLCELYDADDPSTAPTRLVNISTRGKIESGARQMFAGFVVSGTGGRRLLIRGIGPTLRNYGLPTALGSARIQLLDSANHELLANDAWSLATWTDQSAVEFGRVGAFPLTDNSDDAVVLARVTPGQYNVVVSSPGGTAGVGMVEVYED